MRETCYWLINVSGSFPVSNRRQYKELVYQVPNQAANLIRLGNIILSTRHFYHALHLEYVYESNQGFRDQIHATSVWQWFLYRYFLLTIMSHPTPKLSVLERPSFFFLDSKLSTKCTL